VGGCAAGVSVFARFSINKLGIFFLMNETGKAFAYRFKIKYDIDCKKTQRKLRHDELAIQLDPCC
jgi:hypothetical protein